MEPEKRLKLAKHRCLRWLKGFHNLHRSEGFMKRFAEKANSQDHVTKEALFQAAVVSYAKPFTQTESGQGKGVLSLKPFKRDPAFDTAIHEHIMGLRNRLIAHDDLTEIEPKYAWLLLEDNSDPDGPFAPFRADLRNVCISYPQDMGDFGRMYAHVKAAAAGAMASLDSHVVETRGLLVAHPKEARSVFQRRHDSTLGTITGDGKTSQFKMDVSAIETHPVMVVETPHPPTSFGKYRHTTVDVRVLFSGPQGVSLDGSSVTVEPS